MLLQPGRLIPQRFYLRPVEEVARDLLGTCLCHEGVVLRITETEAYGGTDDTASHCRSGRTSRNAPMWKPGGRTYIYLCYGMHYLLNLVTGDQDEGAAVLIRSCEPIAGIDVIQQRRGGIRGQALLTGPGKISQALGLDLQWNDHLLYQAGGLELRVGEDPKDILRGSRVGIPYASPEHREALLRFAVAGTPWVSQKKELRLL